MIEHVVCFTIRAGLELTRGLGSLDLLFKVMRGRALREGIHELSALSRVSRLDTIRCGKVVGATDGLSLASNSVVEGLGSV